jgi:hypothetical protein
MAHILEPITSKGIEAKVTVDSGGRFSAEVPDHGEIYADTYAKLKELVQAAITKVVDRRSKAKPVPITHITHGSRYERGLDKIVFVPGTLTGIHSQNGDLLITTEKGGKQRIDTYGGSVAKRMSPADEAHYKSLLQAEEDARAAILAWKRQWLVTDQNAMTLLGIKEGK